MYKDLETNGFIFRFIKEGNEWVCKMPDWLIDEAVKCLGRKHEVQQSGGDVNSSPLSD